jgi:transposase
VPACIRILLLPPYSPELNPIERLFGYLRSHYLSNRAYDDYQHLLDAGAEAWRDLTPALLRSVCACDYLDVKPEKGR